MDRYSIGDTIPGHDGVVIAVTETSYLVSRPADHETVGEVVPFYGAKGVHTTAPVAGLVTFADGSRYGGAR